MERASARTSHDRRPGSRSDPRVCAWCGHSLPARPDVPERPTSHGICPDCLDDLLAALPPAAAFGACARRGAPRRSSR